MRGGDGNSGAKNGQWVSIPQIVRNIWKYQFNWKMVSENLYQTINSRHNLMVLFAAPLVIVRCERLVAAAGWYPVCGRCYDCSRVHPKCNNLIVKCKHVTSMFFMVYDCALWECGLGCERIPYYPLHGSETAVRIFFHQQLDTTGPKKNSTTMRLGHPQKTD